MAVLADVAVHVVDALTAIAESPVGDALGFIGEVAGNAAEGLGYLGDSLGDFAALTGDYESRQAHANREMKNMGRLARETAGDLSPLTEATVHLNGTVTSLVGKLADDLDLSAISRGAAAMRREVGEQAGALASELAAGGANLEAVSRELALRLPRAVEQNRAEVRRQALLSMVDYAAGLRDKRGQVQAAIDLLASDLTNTLSRQAEVNQLLAQLGGENISKGLKSSDPIVKAQAQGTVALIAQRLEELEVDASESGGQAGKNYATALKGTSPLTAGAANTVAGAANPAFAYYQKNASSWGWRTGKAYADGLRSTYGLVNDAANYVARGAVGPMKASSPPGPESPLHLIDKWGERTIEAWIGGILKGGRSAGDAMRSVAGMAAQGLTPNMPRWSLAGALALPTAGAVPLSGGVTTAPGTVIHNHNVTVPIQGLVKATNPFEIGDRLQRFAENGAFDGREEYE
jgi:hypothetical protein